MGVGFIATDIVTAGAGSLVIGSIKTGGKALLKYEIKQAAAAAAKGGEQLLLTAGKLHKHHVLPQQFRKWFAQRGISNIDDYAVQIGQSTHLKGVHGKGLGAQLPGDWNKQWSYFIKTNPNASPSEIFHHAEGLLKRYGLEHLPYVPYK